MEDENEKVALKLKAEMYLIHLIWSTSLTLFMFCNANRYRNVLERVALQISFVSEYKFPTSANATSSYSASDPQSHISLYSVQVHSQIEKKRRDKMNACITELASLLPCNMANRKLDKLTVLHMAVQHIKSVLAASKEHIETNHRQSFLSDDQVKRLILETADGFFFVIGCDRGRILFVSDSVESVLRYSKNDLLNQSFFDYLHPTDINKVKEQLSCLESSPREQFIDARTMMPLKSDIPHIATRMCSGARRSFFCRMKRADSGEDPNVGMGQGFSSVQEYCQRKRISEKRTFCQIHCTGYLKACPMSSMEIPYEDDVDDSCFINCLVAVAQIKPTLQIQNLPQVGRDVQMKPIQYISRHSTDGKFTYIDQKATLFLGYLPQELVGTSIYEYYHRDDIEKMANIHRDVLNKKEKIQTGIYRFRIKDGSFLQLQSQCFSFINPWSKDVEYILSRNDIILLLSNVFPEEKEEKTLGELTWKPPIENTASGDYVIRNHNDTQPHVDPVMDRVRETEPVTFRPPHRNLTEDYKRQLDNQILPKMSRQPGCNAMPYGLPREDPRGYTCADGASCSDSYILSSLVEECNMTPNSETNNSEIAMSIMMDLMGGDDALGGPMDLNDLTWPL
ncbi:hypothetical protein ScPMuIL_015405 [Solemya velum]